MSTEKEKTTPEVFEFEGEIVETGTIGSRRIKDMVGVVVERIDVDLGFAVSPQPMTMPLTEAEAIKFGRLLYRRVRVRIEEIEENDEWQEHGNLDR